MRLLNKDILFLGQDIADRINLKLLSRYIGLVHVGLVGLVIVRDKLEISIRIHETIYTLSANLLILERIDSKLDTHEALAAEFVARYIHDKTNPQERRKD